MVGYSQKYKSAQKCLLFRSFWKRCFAEELCHSACLKRFWIDVRTPARSTFLQKETTKSSVSVSMQTLDSDVSLYNKERRCHLLKPLVSHMWRQVLSPPIFPISSTWDRLAHPKGRVNKPSSQVLRVQRYKESVFPPNFFVLQGLQRYIIWMIKYNYVSLQTRRLEVTALPLHLTDQGCLKWQCLLLKPFVREAFRELRFEAIRFRLLDGWIYTWIVSVWIFLPFRGSLYFELLSPLLVFG